MDSKGSASLTEENGSKVVYLSLGLLVPNADSVRTIAADDGIEELAVSIVEQGVLQPLLVRPIGSEERAERYEIIAGHRRRRAASIAGLSQVPCIIHDVDPLQGFMLSIVENLHRENLHPLDEAWAYDRMIEKGFAHNRADIARHLGVSRARITQRMELLRLDDKTKLLLIQYATTLTEYHARLLLKVGDLDARHHLAEKAGQDAISGRELRAMIESLEKREKLDAWQKTEGTENLPPSYRAYFPGLRLSVDYSRVDRKRTAKLFRQLADTLDNYPSSNG